MTATHVSTPAECWTERYWLTRCRGFRVSAPDGHVGYVEDVLLGPERTAPAALVVRGGHVVLVPAAEIAGVLPSEERVLLRTRPK